MTEQVTHSEPKRGCGFRQVGKLYLMGEGIGFVCPSLPLPLDPCDICGYEPAQYRDFTWVPKDYFKALKLNHPTGEPCQPECPICYPTGSNTQIKYGLMWVGRKHYTPEAFIIEDRSLGISKAIKQIPRGLTLGKSWVLLAHPRAVTFEDMSAPGELPPKPGVFYAFKPTRIEVLIYKSQVTPERLAKLEAKGITPIIVDDKYTAHSRKSRRVRGRENIA